MAIAAEMFAICRAWRVRQRKRAWAAMVFAEISRPTLTPTMNALQIAMARAHALLHPMVRRALQMANAPLDSVPMEYVAMQGAQGRA